LHRGGLQPFARWGVESSDENAVVPELAERFGKAQRSREMA
jgi:hypothetical protein